MKKIVKWIIIIALLIVFLIDVWGLWKYKLSGTKVATQTSDVSDDVGSEEIAETDNSNSTKDSKIEYKEVTSKSIESDEKLFITDIEKKNNEKYEIRGILFTEYEVTKDEYNAVNKNEKIEINGIEYTKDSVKSGILKLKSSNSDAEDLYIKYDAKTKKYIVKNSKNDFSLYKSKEEYVKISVSGEQLLLFKKMVKIIKRQ